MTLYRILEQSRAEQSRADKSVLFGVCQRDNYRLAERTRMKKRDFSVRKQGRDDRLKI